MAAGQVRITRTDLDFGLICPTCAGPKTKQAKLCRGCDTERLRDEAYWARRTCGCGAPKRKTASRTCRPCADRLLFGNRNAGRPQPQSHRWRRTRYV